MKVLAQQGFGKSTYIDDCIKDGSLCGAILSPRDEDPDSLSACVRNLRELGAEFVAVDPQFYAFTIADARLRNLVKYPYYPGFLSKRSFARSSDLRNFAHHTLQYQASIGVTHLISPSISLVDLTDSFSQIYFTMVQESLDWHYSSAESRPLLLSLVLNETALQSNAAVEEFLNVATSWTNAGIYICVQAMRSQYPSNLGAVALANLLYMIYVLSELNDCQVTVGFADFNSLLFGAAGAHLVSTGWYSSLKQFSLNRWIPAKGGARPRPRYASSELLVSILVEPELSEIVDRDLAEYVLSATKFDQNILQNVVTSNWPASTAYRAHAMTLASIGNRLEAVELGARKRLDFALTQIQRAKSSRLLLISGGVSFQTFFGFLDIWESAIEDVLERLV